MPPADNRSEITVLKEELEASLNMYVSLKKENQELRQEIARLKSQISSLKAHDNERKSLLWKKIQASIDIENLNAAQQKSPPSLKTTEQSLREPISGLRESRPTFMVNKEKGDTTPKLLTTTVVETVSFPQVNGKPPPAGPTQAPPPPPPPPKSLTGIKALRRVPEVVELYRSLTRKDARLGSLTSQTGFTTVTATRSMIGEIENRSTYLSAVKSEVERQGPFIDFLIEQVESATFRDISEVEAFVKWLDDELSSLVDERAVLKHFPRWPERKADALREAAFSYRDMKNLESEVTSFRDNLKEPLCSDLRQIQALQERLEQSVNNMERLRETTSKRYRDFQIPWQWMLETGLIGQMRLGSLRLAKEHMKRVATELRSNEGSREDNLMLQGVRFAFRVHQFASGFDKEAIQIFEQLKKVIIEYGR